jgi:hypothetical protein
MVVEDTSNTVWKDAEAGDAGSISCVSQSWKQQQVIVDLNSRRMSCSGFISALQRVDKRTPVCPAYGEPAVAAMRSIQFRAKRNELLFCSSNAVFDELSNAQNHTTFTSTVSYDTGDNRIYQCHLSIDSRSVD